MVPLSPGGNRLRMRINYLFIYYLFTVANDGDKAISRDSPCKHLFVAKESSLWLPNIYIFIGIVCLALRHIFVLCFCFVFTQFCFKCLSLSKYIKKGVGCAPLC